MSIEIDIDALESLADACTPLQLDTAEKVYSGEYKVVECDRCDGSGELDAGRDYVNIDSLPLGVQFYGFGAEPENAEKYFRAVSPSVIKQLIARLRAAEEALKTAPHWVEIYDPEDAPAGEELVLWDGNQIDIDYTDTEVEYGTTFFANGTEATHYLAGLVPPKDDGGGDQSEGS